MFCIALTGAALTAEGGDPHDEYGALRPTLDRRRVAGCGMCGRVGHVQCPSVAGWARESRWPRLRGRRAFQGELRDDFLLVPLADARSPLPLVLCDKATENGEVESCCRTAGLTDASLPVTDGEAANADRLSDLLLRQAGALP